MGEVDDLQADFDALIEESKRKEEEGVPLSAESLQKALADYSYAEQAVVSAVVGNYLTYGSNWVILPNLTRDIEELVDGLVQQGICKLWKLTFGGVLEVSPRWLNEKLSFLGAKTLQEALGKSKAGWSKVQKYFCSKDTPDEGYVILWGVTNEDKMNLTDSTDDKDAIPCFNVSMQALRAQLFKVGYELCGLEQCGMLPQAQGILALYWKADKDYGEMSAEEQESLMQGIRDAVTFDINDVDIEL
jgi:hypothetical protein